MIAFYIILIKKKEVIGMRKMTKLISIATAAAALLTCFAAKKRQRPTPLRLAL